MSALDNMQVAIQRSNVERKEGIPISAPQKGQERPDRDNDHQPDKGLLSTDSTEPKE